MDDDPRLLLLDEHDDIMVAVAPLRRDERITVAGQRVQVAVDVGLGHKIARRRLEPGAQLHKYGVPIGSVTRSIAIGEHVHVHNLASNYTRTHTMDDSKQADGEK